MNAIYTATISLLLVFASTFATAQLATYNDNAGNLLSPSFFGPDVAISNITYTGHPGVLGSFLSDTTNLGLTKGLVMTTGSVLPPYGPQGPNDNGGEGIDNGFAGDSLLTIVAGALTYNAAILEFDFVSVLDTFKFRYVFGSDEYPEYVGSQFNDAFQISMVGPGIVGSEILSVIPSGTQVSINNVNQTNNGLFYVANGDGSDPPYNSSEYYIQYDGFTVPLYVNKAIIPGETYHLRIAIADAGDGILDSGVFLEECEGCGYNVGLDDQTFDDFVCFPNPTNGNVSLGFPVLKKKY
ncbi:MAG: hypothetical protein ACI865_000951 [Flavobacteriaceae bacterium]|jgi:hypothetical protein